LRLDLDDFVSSSPSLVPKISRSSDLIFHHYSIQALPEPGFSHHNSRRSPSVARGGVIAYMLSNQRTGPKDRLEGKTTQSWLRLSRTVCNQSWSVTCVIPMQGSDSRMNLRTSSRRGKYLLPRYCQGTEYKTDQWDRPWCDSMCASCPRNLVKVKVNLGLV
jgi:hypothetical protein